MDLTLDEFVYVLSNILRTQRYGKESSRQGVVRNHVVGVAFSDVELFANLEFSQALYDAFTEDGTIDLTSGYLSLADFERHVPSVIETLITDVVGRLDLITGEDVDNVLDQVRDLNRDEARFAGFLQDLNRTSASFVIESN